MVRWVGTHVAARICHVWPATIRRWCRDGMIPAVCVEVTIGGHLRINEEILHHLKKNAQTNQTCIEVQEDPG
jgi:predicted site-specific integrase-resolvase